MYISMIGGVGGGMSGTLTNPSTLSGTDARLKFNVTDQAANQKLWDIEATGLTFNFRTRTDADGAGVTWLTVLRGATTSITSVTTNAATSIISQIGGTTITTVNTTGFGILRAVSNSDSIMEVQGDATRRVIRLFGDTTGGMVLQFRTDAARWDMEVSSNATSNHFRILDRLRADYILEATPNGNMALMQSGGSVGIGIAMASVVSRLDLAGNISAAAWTTSGIAFNSRSATYTDTSSSGTVAQVVGNSFGGPTFAASSSTTITNAATLYIAAAPTAGTNVTITKTWGIYSDTTQGTYLKGGLAIGTTPANVNSAGIYITQAASGVSVQLTLDNTQTAAADVGIEIDLNGSGVRQGNIVTGWDGASTAAAYMTFGTRVGSALTEKLRITSAGSIICGTGAVATNATDGFLYIATCTGTPTGVPTSYTGRLAQVYDSSNNKLYVYSGGWKGVTLS